jgi:tetratricopeptide (TPR) repeat protein
VPLDYATTQNNRAVLLSELASLPGEDRGGRLREALAAYDEALAKLRDVPLDYATTQNNRAVLLSELASLPGEDRGGRLREALAAYDEALALRRDVPLDYAQTQSNRANLLSELASLPGEDRGGRLREALAAAADAVRLFEAYQHVQYLEIARSVLAEVVVVMGVGEFVSAWHEHYPAAELPRLTPQELFSALAGQEGIRSNGEFSQRAQSDAQFKARADELIAFALSQGNDEETADGRPIVNDPMAVALSAMLGAENDQSLAQVLADHPVLREADALFAAAGLLNQALSAQQTEALVRLVVLLAVLLDGYNRAHGENVDAGAHGPVIDLCEQVIPLAEQLDAGLAAELRGQAGWACNTLGNHYASEGGAQDLDQAIATYSRGLACDPGNAMLLRNRAGVHLDRRDWAAAQADVEAAAVLEPEASRLAELRAVLAAGQASTP